MLNILKTICTKNNIDFKFIKFIFVGILNTLVGYLLFAFFLLLGLHYSIAATFSTIGSIIFNFFSTGRLVFKNKNNFLIFKFLLVYTLTWLISVGFIYIYKILVNDNEYLAGFIILIPNAILAFVLMKYFVFKAD